MIDMDNDTFVQTLMLLTKVSQLVASDNEIVPASGLYSAGVHTKDWRVTVTIEHMPTKQARMKEAIDKDFHERPWIFNDPRNRPW